MLRVVACLCAGSVGSLAALWFGTCGHCGLWIASLRDDGVIMVFFISILIDIEDPILWGRGDVGYISMTYEA